MKTQLNKQTFLDRLFGRSEKNNECIIPFASYESKIITLEEYNIIYDNIFKIVPTEKAKKVSYQEELDDRNLSILHIAYEDNAKNAFEKIGKIVSPIIFTYGPYINKNNEFKTVSLRAECWIEPYENKQ